MLAARHPALFVIRRVWTRGYSVVKSFLGLSNRNRDGSTCRSGNSETSRKSLLAHSARLRYFMLNYDRFNLSSEKQSCNERDRMQ